MTTSTAMVPSSTLSVTQFQHLAEVPPEIEWFADLTNANTQRDYRQDVEDSMAFNIPSGAPAAGGPAKGSGTRRFVDALVSWVAL